MCVAKESWSVAKDLVRYVDTYKKVPTYLRLYWLGEAKYINKYLFLYESRMKVFYYSPNEARHFQRRYDQQYF